MNWYMIGFGALLLLLVAAIAKVGGDADNRGVQHDEHEGGLPL